MEFPIAHPFYKSSLYLAKNNSTDSKIEGKGFKYLQHGSIISVLTTLNKVMLGKFASQCNFKKVGQKTKD